MAVEVPDRLVAFELERWLRASEKRSRVSIGGSGVPQAPLAPVAPADWERAWRTHPDDAGRAAREAVARAYGVDAEEVVLAQGASEADGLAALALAGPGAHVVVERPAYHALLAPALAVGCRVTRVQRDAREHFALDAEAVIAAMRPDTRLVALARPHNPSGAVAPDADLVRVAEAAERVGAWVLVDEVFADATTLGDRPARLLHERIVSVNSVTKCLGYGRAHIGWLVAADGGAREALDRAKAVMSVVNPVLDLAVVARVVADRTRILAPVRAARAANAGILRRFAAERGLEWSGPEHGTTAVVRLPDGAGDDRAFAERLLAEEGVTVAPGSLIELPGWIRIGLVGPSDALEAGLAAVGRAVGRASG